LPCSNCVARRKESVCHYESESARKQQLREEGAGASPDAERLLAIAKSEANSASQISSLGYVKGDNDTTTLGIFKRVEGCRADRSSVVTQSPPSAVDNPGLCEKYKSLIRQLPARAYIEKLVVSYFHEVNDQYYPLDEGMFRDQLQQWYNLPLSTLNEGPLSLPVDLRFLPALLFQMMALALQYQPVDHDPSLHCLKYAAGMSLCDLSRDYTQSGIAISSLLGKRHTSLQAVQAGFLRTTYLKNGGMIPESWHSLSQTIRDAQEMGLHKGVMDCLPWDHAATAEDALENLWVEQFRRRMWAILTLWDVHMAIVLGRPATIDPRHAVPILPIDAPIPKNRRIVAPSPRTDSDPPTPLTALVWIFGMSTIMWDIYRLEKDAPDQRHVPRIEKLIMQAASRCPPSLRAENPDTRFDSHPDCKWLPSFRPRIQTELAFTFMALHRPYIFTNASSRTTALTACLDVLRSQRELFSMLEEKDYKTFFLVINTFDAIVLAAAIYVLHPNENKDQLDAALQHFEWGMERFQMLSVRNTISQAGLGVLKAIHVRLKKALSSGKTPHSVPTMQSSTRTPSEATPSASDTTDTYSTRSGSSQYISSSQSSITNSYPPPSNPAITHSPQYTQPTISNLTSPTPPPDPAWERFSGNTHIPPNFDFSSMVVPQPVHDLIYNDLSTIADTQMLDPRLGAMDAAELGGVDTNAWQFEGEFRDDSFWGFMNSYSA
jgi:hypothetical protein